MNQLVVLLVAVPPPTLDYDRCVMTGLLRIGALELDRDARELRIAGQRREIEPRVFALLSYLAERPDRVVTKQELHDAVWRDRKVSDAALARTVMKARQAIGDTGDPPLLRNVPRVGYRLVLPGPGVSTVGSHSASSRPARLAMLPFDNATGDVALDWVRLGLMSLVAHSLGHDPRLSIAAMPTTLAAADGARLDGAELVDAVRSATGADTVVCGGVSRSDPGYDLAIECAGVGATRVHAGSAGELAPLAAAAIEALLFPGTAAVDAPAPAGSDPLAMTAFARALQALAQQKYLPAANLLRMTLALAPGSRPVELELLRALCSVGDLDAAQPIARRLLADAERRGDPLLAARVHVALGRVHMYHSSYVPAASHLEQGLRLLGDHGPPDEQARAHLLCAQIAGLVHDVDTAQRALERMRAACERSGDRVLPISRLMMLSSVARSKGDFRGAADLAVQAAYRAREVHAYRNMVGADGIAASDLVQLGRWSEAASHAEQAFAAAVLLGDRTSICTSACVGTWVYMIVGVPAAAQRMVEALPAASELPPLEQKWSLIARANHAASAGDHAEAVRLLTQALQRIRRAGNRSYEEDLLPWLLYSLVHCGQLDQAGAELAAARQTRDPPALDHFQRKLLHCRAQLAHARGQLGEALQLLRKLVDPDTLPLWRGWAALDAAWLCAEQGCAAEALSFLQRVPPEFATLPLASAVAARVQFGAGDRVAAQRLHRQYLEATHNGIVQPFLAGLGACYAGTAAVVPPVPGLPSRL